MTAEIEGTYRHEVVTGWLAGETGLYIAKTRRACVEEALRHCVEVTGNSLHRDDFEEALRHIRPCCVPRLCGPHHWELEVGPFGFVPSALA